MTVVDVTPWPTLATYRSVPASNVPNSIPESVSAASVASSDGSDGPRHRLAIAYANAFRSISSTTHTVSPSDHTPVA